MTCTYPRINIRVPTIEAHRSVGDCRLWCGRKGVDVIWLGVARQDGQSLDAWGCYGCTAYLTRMIQRGDCP